MSASFLGRFSELTRACAYLCRFQLVPSQVSLGRSGMVWDLREWDVASVAFAKQAVQVVRLSRGQLFGELALLGDQPRAASARCASLALIALVL
jgi:CRP-like cAMP-binding protein